MIPRQITNKFFLFKNWELQLWKKHCRLTDKIKN